MGNYQVYNFTEKRKSFFEIDNPFTGSIGEAFDQFLHYYAPDVIAPPPKAKLYFPKDADRKCLFCSKSYPDVTFRNDAHVLPQLVGNKYLIHDSECDQCNDQFKCYEDSFSKYLGMIRTADVIQGKRGVPKYESIDGKLSMRHDKTENGINFISIVDGNSSANKVDESSMLLKGIKQSYIPLHVMKSLLKVGYCLLSAEELPNYTPSLRVITSTVFDGKLKNLAQVAKFTVPVVLKRPFVITYKKKEEHFKENIPTKVVTISFGRLVYQYFMLNVEDRFLFKEGEKCTFMQIPPYFDGDQNKLIAEKVDFSSPDKKSGEVDAMILTFDRKL